MNDLDDTCRDSRKINWKVGRSHIMVAVASESTERYIESVNQIDLSNSDMMSRKMTALSYLEESQAGIYDMPIVLLSGRCGKRI